MERPVTNLLWVHWFKRFNSFRAPTSLEPQISLQVFPPQQASLAWDPSCASFGMTRYGFSFDLLR